MSRRALAHLVVALALGFSFGCRRPSLDIVVRAPDGYDLEDVSLDLRVYAPGNIEDINCEKLDFGAMSVDELNAALVLAQPLDADGVVPEFPVSGDKLVLVEGRDEQGELAFRGCSQLSSFGRNSSLEVALAPAVKVLLQTGDLLEGVVDEPLATVRVEVVDYLGIAVTGADVRAELLGPGGAIVASEEIASSDGGRAELSLSPAVAGPFRLSVRARTERGVPLPTTPGFALPGDTSIDPFSRPGASWSYVWPTRMGDDLAFVGRTATGIPEVVVARSDGAGGFTTTAVDPGFATILLGSFTSDDDGEPWLAFTGQRATLGLRLVSASGVVVDKSLGGDRYEAGRLVPAGSCEDDQAGPAVMSLRLVDLDLDPGLVEGPTHIALVDPADDVVIIDQLGEGTEPLFSVCREVGGTLWRVIVVRQRGRIGLVAIDGGVDDVDALQDLVDQRQGLPGAVLAGPVLAGDADLVTTRLAGFRSVVELQRTEFNSAGEVRLTPSPLFDVPSVPTQLSAAAVLGDDEPEVLGLLYSREGEVERGLLMLGARTADDDSWIVGGASLEACVDTTCALTTFDIDGDSEHEVIVGMGVRTLNAPQPDVIAQIIDFEDG
jgi:hypothetical protein